VSSVPEQFRLLWRNDLRLYLRSGQLSFVNTGLLLLGQMLLHAIALGIAMVWMAGGFRSPAACADSDARPRSESTSSR
jgi:hypothetical protein